MDVVLVLFPLHRLVINHWWKTCSWNRSYQFYHLYKSFHIHLLNTGDHSKPYTRNFLGTNISIPAFAVFKPVDSMAPSLTPTKSRFWRSWTAQLALLLLPVCSPKQRSWRMWRGGNERRNQGSWSCPKGPNVAALRGLRHVEKQHGHGMLIPTMRSMTSMIVQNGTTFGTGQLF
jgi:hypothetical protein